MFVVLLITAPSYLEVGADGLSGAVQFTFRKKVYRSIEELQADLDEWVRQYNEQRTHQGRWCFGKTPMQTFLDSRALAREKQNMEMAA